jgi:hypothetical protein
MCGLHGAGSPGREIPEGVEEGSWAEKCLAKTFLHRPLDPGGAQCVPMNRNQQIGTERITELSLGFVLGAREAPTNPKLDCVS